MNNALAITGLCLLCLLLLGSLWLYVRFFPSSKDAHERTASLSFDAAIVAIILIMTFVPNMGFIFVTPFISFTLLHLPVLLGAALFGWKKGLLYGLVFGICSYVQALLQGAGFNLLFAYPWTAIPPRAVFGLLAGLAFSFIRKLHNNLAKSLYLGLGSAVLTAIHTGLVFLTLYAFFPAEVSGLLGSSDPLAEGTGLTFLLAILLGMVGEMGLAAVLVPSLYLAITKAVPSLGKKHRRKENA